MPNTIAHSPSSLIRFKACNQRRYWELKDRTKPMRVNEGMLRGAAIDAALTTWGQAIAQGQHPDDLDVDGPFDLLSLALPAAVREDARRVVHRAIERMTWPAEGAFYQFPVAVTAEWEACDAGEMPGDAPPDTWIRGRIDRLVVTENDGVRTANVTDWKGDRSVPDEVPEEYAFQVRLYAAMLSTMRREPPAPFDEVSCGIYWLSAGRYDAVDASHLIQTATEAGSLASAIESGDLGGPPWPAHPTARGCATCQHLHQCTAYRGLSANADAVAFPIQSADQAEEAYRLFALAKEVAGRLDKALKAFAEDVGPIVVPEGVLDWKQYPGRVFKGRDGVRDLLEAGATAEALYENLSVSKTEAKKILRSAGLKGKAADQWLADHGEPKTTRRFVLSKGQLLEGETDANESD